VTVTATVTEPTLDQQIRLSIFQQLVATGRPMVIEEVMTEYGLSRAEAVAVMQRLADARHVALVKGTSRVLMAFPFSAIATPFRVHANGRDYFANCAWDAVAFHSMLDAPISIDSYCHHCATPIHIEMADGRAAAVEPQEAIVYLALKPKQWWEDIITTCSNTMVFFASPEHRDASDLNASPDSTASLAPELVHELGKPIYSTKLSIDYERPTFDALKAHFATLGLTSSYWQG